MKNLDFTHDALFHKRKKRKEKNLEKTIGMQRLCKTPCTLRSIIGDPDETFAYRTTRTLLIRDWRVGLALLFLQFVVFLYIVVYQVYFTQVYFQISGLVSTVRLNSREPTENYRWNSGSAPFCLGTVNPSHPSTILAGYYTIDSARNKYSYIGPGGNPAISFPQRNCSYLDEALSIPLFEDDRNFFITEVRELVQSLRTPRINPNADCNSLQNSSCIWQPPNGVFNDLAARSYVPDIEFFTVLIDRSCEVCHAAFSIFPSYLSLFP